MSILKCDFCSERIDTDECPEFHDEILDKWACDLCHSYKYALALREALSAMRAERDAAVAREKILHKALEKIAKWFGEFPITGQKYADGTSMSYGVCYGSNGERDFMRGIASEAIKATES